MTFKAALVQLRSGRDQAANLAEASRLIRQAAAQGADFIVTPEVTNVFDPDKERLKASVHPESSDLSVHGFSVLARELGVTIHVGSFALKGEDGKLVNRAILFGPDGRKIAHYDKIHLFDIDLPNGESYRESAVYTPGKDAVAVALPFAKIGLAICYDMRFPKLFNALASAGASVLVIPAAFTVPTGQAHWHVLLRARAIETGSYVLAAAQGGTHDGGQSTYGHSLIISPWGEIIAEADVDPCVIMAEIDPAKSAEARSRIPALVNARSFDLKPVDGTTT